MVGALLLRFRHASARTLALVGLLPLLFGVALAMGWSLIDLGDADGLDEALEKAKRDGPFLEVLAARPFDYLGWLIVSSLTSFNWRVVGLFFVGAAVMKAGLVDRSRRAFHRRTAWTGLLLGGGLQLLVVGLVIVGSRSGESASVWAGLGVALATEVGSLALAAGYAASVVLAVHAGVLPWLQRALAAVGRTALTNYLLQSVAMNLVFFTIGLGLYDRLSGVAVLTLFSGVFALQIVASVIWLRSFTMGPVEWFWRTRTYGRRIPLRRT